MLIGRVTLNIPFLHCRVRASFLGLEGQLPVEAYAFAVTAVASRPFLFSVHLQNGAVFSRLPVNALMSLSKDAPLLPLKELDVWGAIGIENEITVLDYFKDYVVSLKDKSQGRYLWSIDPLSGAFAEDPEQSKILHFVELDSGNFTFMPNNSLLFLDRHFTEEGSAPMPRRNRKYYYLV